QEQIQQIDNLNDIVYALSYGLQRANDEVSFHKRSCILMEASIKELCKEKTAEKPDGTKKSS
ncbi:hypothetical protein LCGC14_1816800, partial [marine sediment metagenome]